MDSGLVRTALDAITAYGRIRTFDGHGVTIPSQIRYIHYYERCLRGGYPIRDDIVELKSVKMIGSVQVSGWAWCIVKCDGNQIFSSHVCTIFLFL